MTDGAERDPDQKAAFRRWARENHPDVGGDAARFAAGVRAWQEGKWQEGRRPVDHFEPSPHAGRGSVYVQRSARGIARVIVATQRWNERRRRPPRVR